MHKRKPYKDLRIIVTMGDAAGIGPELCLDLLNAEDLVTGGAVRLAVLGSAEILRRVADLTGKPFSTPVYSIDDDKQPVDIPSVVLDLPFSSSQTIEPGRVQASCGRAAAEYIRRGVQLVLNGDADGLVTCPINKEALRLAGEKFAGHTEMLQALTGARYVCMQLASPRITVSLATTHCALSAVSKKLTVERVVKVIELTVAAFEKRGVKHPRLGVCALNPHAGENGLFGDEEQRVIIPALDYARKKGLNVDGPLVPDTAFLAERLAAFDAYIVMYHDQGLIPFKMLAFEDGVNVTLGLPVVRTSPDHGTAFDLAWQGRASSSSLYAAVRMAVSLCSKG